MIEMFVRMVDRHPRTGVPVAVLQPRAAGDCPVIALTITSAEACSLSHELEQHNTLRSQAYALLVRALAESGGKPIAAEILPAGGNLATARLRLVHPGGSAEVPLEVGQAISLAICLPVPLLVSEDFVSAIEAHEGSSAANPPLEVPTAFRQAFDD